MPGERLSETVAQIQEWTALGRDVIVTGEPGSGRTAVLDAFVRDLTARRVHHVALKPGLREPYGAIIQHEDISPRTVAARSTAALADWLAAETAPRGAVVTVDDVDELDDGSLFVIRRALARSTATLVVTTTRDLSRSSGELGRLVSERAPAQVSLEPLGFGAMQAMLTTLLGGQVDVSITATVSARSGGNPRVARALVDGARQAGVIRREGETWVKSGRMEDARIDMVAHALATRMSNEDVDALELLAWTGPTTRDVAAGLVGEDRLKALAAQNRLVEYVELDESESVVVYPPALARALRDRLRTSRVHELQRQVDAAGDGAILRRPTRSPQIADVLLAPVGTSCPDFVERAAELAGLIHERQKAREATAFQAWQLAPDVRHANELLAVLMLRPATAQTRAVVDGTELAADDAPADRSVFRWLDLRLTEWEGADRHDLERFAAAHAGELAWPRAVGAITGEVLDRARSGADDAELLRRAPLPPGHPGMAEWGTFAHAAALFDVGRPDLALELIDRPRPHTEPGDLDRYVEGIRGLSLMALGRFEEAHDWEHDLLARAYDDLDALGIRVHACVLAEVLARSGHTEQAWHILSTSLRLGPAGPIETTFYRRSLALGAVLCAAAGDPLVARSLAQALTARPAGAAALLQTPSALALVAASPADAAAAEVLLWEHGLAHLEAGRLLPALICWLSGPGPRSTDQMRQIRALRERVHVPALDPAFAHLEALERGDAEAAAALQPQVRELMLWVDPSAPPRARVPRGDRGRVAGALTAREREVVRLYRSGMSAAQIAERLDVSTRTAENHIYRARHKLGATDGSWPWDGLSGGE